MPHRQQHRGRHPEDDDLSRPESYALLRRAVEDLSWLYTRGYSDTAAIKLVGDRFQLTRRQRMALQRAACADHSLAWRKAHEAPPDAMTGAVVSVDGYNLLITIEAALSNALLIRGRDGCIRDLASLHGSYRKVEETLPALELIGASFARFAPAEVHWHFDAPVSNSGRLRALMLQMAETRRWPWRVALTQQVDREIAAADTIVITADSAILNRARRWVNFAATVITHITPPPEILDLA
ncbi:MAG: DUF434 domain-containing protein [Candidatus Hydrogenedentes bacterium]|nr:DUF434 domain-containing protein [Candidatus Hydrogenedentota bacterium]